MACCWRAVMQHATFPSISYRCHNVPIMTFFRTVTIMSFASFIYDEQGRDDQGRLDCVSERDVLQGRNSHALHKGVELHICQADTTR